MNIQSRWWVLGLMVVLAIGLIVGLGSAGAGPATPAEGPEDFIFDRQTVQPSADTTIHSFYPQQNYAARGSLTLRSGDVSAALMQFDLSTIQRPAGVVVAQALLKVYVLSRTNASFMGVSAYAVHRPWVATEATWVMADQATPWAVAGCNGRPEDRSDQGSPVTTLREAEGWVTLDVSDIVRGWMDGTMPNNGLILKTTHAGSVAYEVASMEHREPALRPVLEVLFAPMPTPTPTPIRPVLVLEKTGPQGPLSDGSGDISQIYTLTYQITLRNAGTQDATGVIITDSLPLGTVFSRCTGGGLYDATTHAVVWKIGNLPMGAQENLELELKLARWVKETGTVVNLAQATCAELPDLVVEDYWETLVVPPERQYRMVFVEVFNGYRRD